MTAPKGNQNALKHGQRCRSPFQTGGPAKGTGHVYVALRQISDVLTAAVVEQDGEVSWTKAALINSALRWERVALLGTKYLRTEGNALPTLDRMNLVRSIAQASDSRDKCIKALEIEAKGHADLLARAYATPLVAAHATNGDDTTKEADNAANAQDATPEAPNAKGA